MAGRQDYEERRQARIDILSDAAYKASSESNAAIKRSFDLTKDIPLGQPNINGALTGVMNKSRNAADRSLKLCEKANYYERLAESAENNRAISSDDPEAIEKLKNKLEELENEREKVKEFNKAAKKNGTEKAPWYRLPYLSKDIKRIKDRIAQLERVDQMPAEIIKFDGGEIDSNAYTNRVIIRFDERQDDETITRLKNYGFRWAPSEKGWQRFRNPTALQIAKRIVGIGK